MRKIWANWVNKENWNSRNSFVTRNSLENDSRERSWGSVETEKNTGWGTKRKSDLSPFNSLEIGQFMGEK